MNYAKYKELNIDCEKERGAGKSTSDEEDVNKVERDVQDIELRVLCDMMRISTACISRY
jgi:hypothetical protein